MKQILRYLARVLPDQGLSKAKRIRLVADTMIKGVRLRAVHGRSELDEFAAGGGANLFGALHQPLSHAATACPSIDHQCRNAHDRACVLQHPTQMRCEKSNDLAIGDGEKNRIRPGFAELSKMLCRLPDRDCVPQLTQKGAHCNGIVGRTRSDIDHIPLPIPRSSLMRSAAFRPEPVSTATVVWSAVIVPSESSLVSAAPAVAAVGSTKSPSLPSAASAGAISSSATATTPPRERRKAARTSAMRTGFGVAIPSATVGAIVNGTNRSPPAAQAAANAAQLAAWTAKSRGRAVISPLSSSSSKPRSRPRILLP